MTMQATHAADPDDGTVFVRIGLVVVPYCVIG